MNKKLCFAEGDKVVRKAIDDVHLSFDKSEWKSFDEDKDINALVYKAVTTFENSAIDFSGNLDVDDMMNETWRARVFHSAFPKSIKTLEAFLDQWHKKYKSRHGTAPKESRAQLQKRIQKKFREWLEPSFHQTLDMLCTDFKKIGDDTLKTMAKRLEERAEFEAKAAEQKNATKQDSKPIADIAQEIVTAKIEEMKDDMNKRFKSLRLDPKEQQKAMLAEKRKEQEEKVAEKVMNAEIDRRARLGGRKRRAIKKRVKDPTAKHLLKRIQFEEVTLEDLMDISKEVEQDLKIENEKAKKQKSEEQKEKPIETEKLEVESADSLYQKMTEVLDKDEESDDDNNPIRINTEFWAERWSFNLQRSRENMMQRMQKNQQRDDLVDTYNTTLTKKTLKQLLNRK
ncbi:Protein CBG28012 [Caenorhabditis briggsae]|uniref:Uncharacterized protein n=2 Tax=Caenorhabditis briggsae TaxID=6238 RepID=A0AAE9CWB2_CAEBR|nr:Protein CBG28012 [Caenorhabditis briggsae]ULT84207.1 hypothetical protein L3Y34_013090 [Caenorhabditis briggsae]UMM43449.1 hypothetical protein L5515_018938 [Caenorhabditis briggsae]CAR98838.1 Protein CBG28012 [Caenorhabditis briggsae]